MDSLLDCTAVLLSGAASTWISLRLWPGPGLYNWALKLASLWALWTGIASATLYLFHRLELPPLGLLLAALGSVLIVWLWLGRLPVGRLTQCEAVEPPERIRRLIIAAALITVAAAAFGLILHLIHRPYGWYDASMTWNPKASLLAEHAGPWQDFASSLVVLQYPDRPLLLPASVAWGLRLIDLESRVIPVFISCAFGLAVLLTVTGSLGRVRGKWIAICGLLCLLCQYQFVKNAGDQLADMPAAFFLVLALSLILSSKTDDGRPTLSRSLAAGFFLGAAIWTKPEGWLYLAAACMACPLALRGFQDRGLSSVLSILLGAAPWMALAFLHAVGMGDHSVVASLSSGGLSKLFDPDRHATILVAVLASLFDWSLGLWVLLLGTCWWSARAAGRRADASLRLAAWMLAIIALGFYLVYVITALDLAFHLRSSLDRLLCQLWPSVVLVSLWQADGRLLGCDSVLE
ncbi:MAG: hypothetical protein ACYTG5_09745 [Planctomycetota bacterium]|jgi:hypothetical protein